MGILAFEPVSGSLLATLFSWTMTALGAATVYCFRKVDGKWLDSLLGFGAGVMLAASFWSLILPAIERSGGWFIPALGLLMGGLFIQISEHCLDFSTLLKKNPSGKRNVLLVLAVTLHNIPEGMAIGVAFALEQGSAPWILALGIGLQNLPEGAAVSLPLRKEGISARKSFFLGQASGFVELLSALFAVLIAIKVSMFLPFLLAFSAGAMMVVIAGELLPEAAIGHKQECVRGFLLGFLLMMALDVALG